MSRRRSALTVAGLAGVVAAGLVGSIGVAAPASASPATPPGAGWQRYHQQPFVDPAGNPCAFEVDVTVVRDEEYYRTLASNPDGSPRLQEFTGPLFLRYTNAATGRAVTRDLSGTAFFAYGEDGSTTALWSGAGGVTAHPGNVGLAPGEWVFTGAFHLSEDAAGNVAVHQFYGTHENICTTLG